MVRQSRVRKTFVTTAIKVWEVKVSQSSVRKVLVLTTLEFGEHREVS